MSDWILNFWIPELSQFYDEEGARLWLTSPHLLLGGRRPIDVIAAGETAKVEALLDQLRSGAFI